MNRASCPIKTESPLLTQHPVMLWNTVGEECRNLLTLSFFCFLTPPSLCATSPIAHTCAEEEINAFLLNCLCFCACFDFSAIPRDDRTRQGGEFDTRFVAVAADVFNSSVLRTPPLYFALQNTEEEFLRVTSIHL